MCHVSHADFTCTCTACTYQTTDVHIYEECSSRYHSLHGLPAWDWLNEQQSTLVCSLMTNSIGSSILIVWLRKLAGIWEYSGEWVSTCQMKTRKMLFNAIVLPHLDYCCVVWANCTKELQQKLQRLHNYGMRIILQVPARSPRVGFFFQLSGWALVAPSCFTLQFQMWNECRTRGRQMLPFLAQISLTQHNTYFRIKN